jgi:hypothetical protein
MHSFAQHSCLVLSYPDRCLDYINQATPHNPMTLLTALTRTTIQGPSYCNSLNTRRRLVLLSPISQTPWEGAYTESVPQTPSNPSPSAAADRQETCASHPRTVRKVSAPGALSNMLCTKGVHCQCCEQSPADTRRRYWPWHGCRIDCRLPRGGECGGPQFSVLTRQ